MKVIVSAGGTGGHVYPALALARYLREHEHAEIIFIGTNHKMEATEVPKAGFTFMGLDASGFQGSLTERLHSLQLVTRNIGLLKKKMREFKPDIVIGFGGYVTVAVMMAAKQLRIPTMIHEQNSVAGLANKVIGRFVDGIVISFAQSRKDFPKLKTRLLGSPRASEAVAAAKDPSILQQLQLSPRLPILYIVMGSLGSSSMNAHMVDVLRQLNKHPNIQVLYVTGPNHFEQMKEQTGTLNAHIRLVPFVDQMRLLPHISAICCRAGATTLAEITALGIPALIVPSPYVAHNHQVLNARELGDQKAAFVVEEKDLTCQDIVDKLLALCTDPIVRETMTSNSLALSFPHASRDMTTFMKEIKKG